MRAFIAADMDPSIKASLTDLLRKLRWHGPKGISWVREPGLHITLKFLGDVDEILTGRIAAVLESAARAVPAFPVVIRGTGTFPGAPRAPRVLWAGTDEPAAFSELFARLEAGLAGLGFEPESRPFHPHLTLGRVKNPTGIHDAIVELERAKDAEFGSMTVGAITLFQSILKPDGAVYSVLGEARLS